VEQNRKAVRIIRENLESLGVKEGFEILEMDLAKALDSCSRRGIEFDIAFVDPPYDADDLYNAALAAVPLKPDGLLILEHSKRKDLPQSAGRLRKTRSLVQGDAALAFYA
jgi:16S rRNA G966 N2-methylase RsmD